MSEPRLPLAKGYVWCLAALVGGSGWLAVSFGRNTWHVVLGMLLVLVAAKLVRLARNGG